MFSIHPDGWLDQLFETVPGGIVAFIWRDPAGNIS